MTKPEFDVIHHQLEQLFGEGNVSSQWSAVGWKEPDGMGMSRMIYGPQGAATFIIRGPNFTFEYGPVGLAEAQALVKRLGHDPTRI